MFLTDIIVIKTTVFTDGNYKEFVARGLKGEPIKQDKIKFRSLEYMYKRDLLKP